MKKILFLFLSFLCLLSATYGTLEDNFDRANSSILGIGTNGNNWTETEASGSYKISSNQFHFDMAGNAPANAASYADLNITQNATRIDLINLMSTSAISSNLYPYIFIGEGDLNTASNRGIYIFTYRNTGTSLQYYYSSTWQTTSSGVLTANTYYNISFRNINYATHTYDIYLNDVSIKTGAIFNANVGMNKIRIQNTEVISTQYDTYIDCISTNGAGCDISTPLINHNIQNFYNSTNISINLTTTTNVNMSYILNTGSEISIKNNTNSTTLNLTSLSVGLNNITLISKDLNGQANITTSFTIDLIVPIINNNILFEYNYYNINFNSTCSDPNLDYCNITLNNQTLSLNSSIFTSSLNGNISYFIEAQDLAGNIINETGVILFNPYQYFRIYDSIRLLYLENYIFGNYNSSGQYISIPIYDLGPGSHVLEFVKSGYDPVNKTIIFNQTSSYNITYNVTPVNLYVNVLSMFDKSEISNFTSKIYKNDVLVYNATNLSEISLYYNSTISGELKIIILKDNYIPLQYYVDLTEYSSINQEFYMLADNTSFFVPIIVMNLAQTRYIENVSVSLYAIDDFEEYLVTQSYTDTTGKVYFELISDYLYKVVLSKNGYVQNEYYLSTGSTSYTFLLSEESSSLDYLYSGFSFKFYNASVSNQTILYAKYFDEDSQISSVSYRVYSNSYDNTTYSINSLSDTLEFPIPLNNTDGVFYLQLSVVRDGELHNFYDRYYVYDIVYNESLESDISDVVNNEVDSFSKTILIIGSVLVFFIIGAYLFGVFGCIVFGLIGIIVLWKMSILTAVISVPLILFLLLALGLILGGVI